VKWLVVRNGPSAFFVVGCWRPTTYEGFLMGRTRARACRRHHQPITSSVQSASGSLHISTYKRTDGLFSVGAGTRIQWDYPEQRNLAILRSHATLEVIKSAVTSRSFVVTFNYSLKAERLQGFYFVTRVLTAFYRQSRSPVAMSLADTAALQPSAQSQWIPNAAAGLCPVARQATAGPQRSARGPGPGPARRTSTRR
jgi:hypothetical protein